MTDIEKAEEIQEAVDRAVSLGMTQFTTLKAPVEFTHQGDLITIDMKRCALIVSCDGLLGVEPEGVFYCG